MYYYLTHKVRVKARLHSIQGVDVPKLSIVGNTNFHSDFARELRLP